MELPPLDEEFGYKARRELALCLDPIAPMGNDWRLLMDAMGFAYTYIHHLEQEKSPTIKLLEVWTRSAGGKATISLLKEYISKLEPQRNDAVDVVKKYMKLSGIFRPLLSLLNNYIYLVRLANRSCLYLKRLNVAAQHSVMKVGGD